MLHAEGDHRNGDEEPSKCSQLSHMECGQNIFCNRTLNSPPNILIEILPACEGYLNPPSYNAQVFAIVNNQPDEQYSLQIVGVIVLQFCKQTWTPSSLTLCHFQPRKGYA